MTIYQAPDQTLLEEFLERESSPEIRRRIGETLANIEVMKARFTSGRFDLTIQRQDDTVMIEDSSVTLEDEATGSVRVQRVPIAEFAGALNRSPMGGAK